MHELELAIPEAIPVVGVRIEVRGKERAYTHWLPEGESVMIGSDKQCRIRIVDPSISERQCLVQLRAGKIFVHDWASERPTLVNGKPADSSIALSAEDCITFGDFNLGFYNSTEETVEPIAPLGGASLAHGMQPNEQDGVETDDILAVDDGWGELHRESDELLPEVSVESSTVELLTAELEVLQIELSEKNALLEEYSNGIHHSPNDRARTGDELERRIELLLFELDQSDQRVSAMEEVIRLSEEAHDAELEEKRQIEAWVNDIDERLAVRELEMNAECEVLRKRLGRVTQERQQAEGQISNLIDDREKDGALQDMVRVLRHENEQLSSELDKQSHKVETLAKELQERERNSTEAAVKRRIDDALRVERLERAQERAALSRQQLEMSARISELEQQAEKQIDNRTRLNPADEKFRAFRDQLKELHEQEKREFVPPTLTQRLANVWRKLDGPTDTD